MKKYLLPLFLVVLLVLTSLFFLKQGKLNTSPQQAYTVKIGYQPINANLPLFVALEKGYFKEEGVQVDPVKFDASNPIVDGLYSNRLDGASSVATAALIPAALKSPDQVKAYMLNEATPKKYYYVLIVKRDSNIKSIADLKNKKLGVFPGSAPSTFAKIILKNYMNVDKDITLSQLAPELQVQALATRNVDALLTLEPFGTIAEVQGVGTVLIKGPVENYVVNPYYGGLFVFTSTFLKDHPEEAKKVQIAMEKAVEFINTDEKNARLTLLKYTPMKEGVALKASTSLFKKSSEINVAKLQELADILFENKVIDTKIDVHTLLLNN